LQHAADRVTPLGVGDHRHEHLFRRERDLELLLDVLEGDSSRFRIRAPFKTG
jgi:hypothetical protein